MVSTCCVPNCTAFKQKGRKHKFHRFPKTPTHKQKWIEALYKEKYFEPADTSFVCGKHFTQFDYIVNEQGTEVLVENAVPSVFDVKNELTEGKVNTKDNQKNFTASEDLDTINPNTTSKIFPKSPAAITDSVNVPVVRKINKNNFLEICRCCVINKGEANIFEEKIQNILLSDLIYFCTMERVFSRDDLPSSICKVCKQQIIKSFAFINKMRDNQIHIRKLQQIFKLQEQSSNSSFSNQPNKSYNTPARIVYNNSHSESKNSGVDIFKEKYKGLAKVHKELCNILSKNKMQVKKRVKTTMRKRSFPAEECVKDKMVQGLDLTPNQPNICLEEKTSSRSISEVPYPQNESILLKYLLSSKNCQIKKVAKNNINVSQDEAALTKAQNPLCSEKLKCPDDSGMKMSPECRDADDDVINYQINTVPKSKVKSNEETFLQSTSDNDTKINDTGHLSETMQENSEEEKKEAKSVTRCFECLKVFETEAKIIRHCRVTGHVMTDRFKCDLCLSTFHLKRIYKMHLQQHNESKCICEICGASVASKNIRRHLQVHSNIRNHVCQFCGKCYAQKVALEDHIKYHHNGEGYNSLCFMCGKSFKNSSGLNKHLNDEHIEDDLVNKSYQCDICEKFFISEASLKFHRTFSHSEIPVRRGRMKKKFSADDTIEKPKQKQKLRFKQCTICLKSVNATGFIKHVRIHQGIKPYECKVCGTHFRQKSHLKSHMNIHLNKKPYKCKYCHNCYRHSVSLITHVRSHTGEKPYRCPVCDKGFVHSSTMKTHHQTHFKKSRRVRNRRGSASTLFPKKRVADEENEAKYSDYSTTQFDSK